MPTATDLPGVLTRTADLLCVLLASTSGGAPDECGVYWGDPPADCCPAGYVWLERVYETKPFPLPSIRPFVCPVLLAAVVAVRVRRCWPGTVNNPSNPFPPAATTQPVALGLVEDAGIVYCGLQADFASPSSTILVGVDALTPVMLGDLTHEKNLGGCAGFTVRYTMMLSPCCETGS